MSKKVIHKNPWYSLEHHVLPNGNNYYFLNKQPSVFIVAQNDKDEIILISEYRYPINKIIWQLPAGMIDKDPPLTAAKRELREETGLTAKKWKKLGYFYSSPGHDTTKIIVFLAKDLSMQAKDEEDDIKKIKAVSKQILKRMIQTNKIECGISLAALNLYFNISK